MGMRADQDVIADDHGMPGAAADHGVLHHDAPRAQGDLPVLGGEHGTEQHASAGTDAHGAAQHGRRRDIRAGIDFRDRATMFNQHGSSLPVSGTGDTRSRAAAVGGDGERCEDHEDADRPQQGALHGGGGGAADAAGRAPRRSGR